MALALGKWLSELHALSFGDFSWTPLRDKVYLKVISASLSETQLASSPRLAFAIPSLDEFVGIESREYLRLYPVRCLFFCT